MALAAAVTAGEGCTVVVVQVVVPGLLKVLLLE